MNEKIVGFQRKPLAGYFHIFRKYYAQTINIPLRKIVYFRTEISYSIFKENFSEIIGRGLTLT